MTCSEPTESRSPQWKWNCVSSYLLSNGPPSTSVRQHSNTILSQIHHMDETINMRDFRFDFLFSSSFYGQIINIAIACRGICLILNNIPSKNTEGHLLCQSYQRIILQEPFDCDPWSWFTENTCIKSDENVFTDFTSYTQQLAIYKVTVGGETGVARCNTLLR